MTRLEALAQAIDIVDKLAPTVGANGYKNTEVKSTERVDLILKVADWLLQGEGHLESVPVPGPAAGGSIHVDTHGFQEIYK